MQIQIEYLKGREITKVSIPVATIKEAREKLLLLKNTRLYDGKKVIGKPLIT